MLDHIGMPDALLVRDDVDDQPFVGEAEVGLIDPEQVAHRAARAVRADDVMRPDRGRRFRPFSREGQRHLPGPLLQPGQRPAAPDRHVRQSLELAGQHPLEIGLVEAVRLRPARRARPVPVDLEQRLARLVEKSVRPLRADHRVDQRRERGAEPGVLKRPDRLVVDRARARQRVEVRPPLIKRDRQPALPEEQRGEQADRARAHDSDIVHQRFPLHPSGRRVTPPTSSGPPGNRRTGRPLSVPRTLTTVRVRSYVT